jgi:flagellar protein FliO/FliZ
MHTLRQLTALSLLTASGFVHAVESDVAKSKTLSGGGLSDPNMAGSLIETTLGLLVVLAVIGGVAWAFKRFGHFQTGVQGKLKIVGGVSLGARERVVLLQVGDQQLVVGVAPGQIQTLHVLNEPLPEGNDSGDAPTFSSRLQSAMARHVANKINKGAEDKKSDGDVDVR